jgi:hypothetical protein
VGDVQYRVNKGRCVYVVHAAELLVCTECSSPVSAAANGGPPAATTSRASSSLAPVAWRPVAWVYCIGPSGFSLVTRGSYVRDAIL